MKRRVFSREFKVEAVKLIKERGVAVVQVARDLDVAESVLRRWPPGRRGGSSASLSWARAGQAGAAGTDATASRGRQAEGGVRHPKKMRRPTLPGSRYEIRLRGKAPRGVAGELALRGAWCFAQWLSCLALPAAQRQGCRR